MNLYKHSLLFFEFDKEGILNRPGIKYIKKGVSIDIPKLIKESFNK